jgi:folate-dependent tRNA-U54 methylase TrmFO/GidA
LYHAIKFVKNSELEDKRRYTSLVRATLSQSELTLLFYNCLSPVGQKFKPMVEEFGLLKNLDHRLLMDSEDDKLLVGLYNPKAFQ